MKRPNVWTRSAGQPLVAALLFVGYVGAIYGWYQGFMAWWLALACAAAAMRTIGAVRRMRAYKAWHAEWEAMGAGNAPARRRNRNILVRVAAMLALALPFVAIPLRDSQTIPYASALADALNWLWVIACLVLLARLAWKLVALARRALRRVSDQRKADAELAPVSLLLPCPTSSPSREDAEAHLPDYCSGLIGGSSAQLGAGRDA